MFTALIEKLVRHEDLTADEAAAAMQEVMDGRVSSGALAGLAQGMTSPRVNLANLTSVQRDLLARLVAVQSAPPTR